MSGIPDTKILGILNVECNTVEHTDEINKQSTDMFVTNNSSNAN